MKILLIIVSISGTLNFKYYLSHKYILVEHSDMTANESTYHLLDIGESKIHHIDKDFTDRMVNPYDPNHVGNWSSNVRKERYLEKSKKYFFQGYECVDRKFEITIPSDSPLNISEDLGERAFIMNKVYCSLPLINEYITDKTPLHFLSIYKEFKDDFNFCLNSYYEDNPSVSVGAKVEKIEEILVGENFFSKFYLVEGSNTK